MDLRWWWKRKLLVATRSFIIGLGPKSVHVVKGTSIYFDGVTVQYGVDKFTCPNLTSAVLRGWAVPSAKYRQDDPSYGRPETAPIRVKFPPAEPFIVTSSSRDGFSNDEREKLELAFAASFEADVYKFFSSEDEGPLPEAAPATPETPEPHQV